MLLRARLLAAAAALTVVAAAAPLAHAGTAPTRPGAPGWLVGAATVDVTPPPFDPTADAAAFPTCPASVFTGRRAFAFEEPYVDLNGDGRFGYGEPFCDANHNGRYDGIWLSSGTDHLARRVHDPIDARAVAFSDGRTTAVLVSVVSQGLFETYTHRMRDRARTLRPGITDLIVSANHNESSPDAIGIYGSPDLNGTAGGRSGIDDYYMAFLVERVAQASAAAYDAMRPATIRATTFPLPADVHVELSHNFPTTDDQRRPAAVDPKVRLLDALDTGGRPIVTMMNLAAHNQEIGHSGYGELRDEVSSDWPGWFHRRLERAVGGTAVFLVGDNGSEEDPQTVPPVSTKDHPECSDGCYAQAKATGEALADAVAAHRAEARPIARGAVFVQRDEFFVPLENNLFRAAGAAGLFGERVGYVAGVPAGPGVGTEFRTEVGLVELGPDVQFLANPGEAFPALLLGSPWGVEDASCPDRPNPPVPAWNGRGRVRFQVGLADDLIGYLIPAWGFSSQPGVYATTCFDDPNDRDPRGHQHKLEAESIGPTAGNLVAEHLAALLAGRPGVTRSIVRGRFVRADGMLSRSPLGAVGVWLADGRLLAVDGVRSFGGRRVDGHGRFVDYDGQGQDGADVSTRGFALGGDQPRRGPIYLSVYDDLPGSPPRLGPAA